MNSQLALSAPLPQGCMCVHLSVSLSDSWGRPLSNSTLAQKACEGWHRAAVSPPPSRLPDACLLREGGASASCWLLALQLGESANPSQGLEWAQHFSERSGEGVGKEVRSLAHQGSLGRQT